MASQAGGGQFGGGSGQGAGAASAWSRMANNSLTLLDPPLPSPLLLPAPAQTPVPAPVAKPVPAPPSCPVPPPAPLKIVQSCPLRQQGGGVAALLAPHKPQSLEPCDLNAMTITVPPADESLWARFMSQGWLGTLIKEAPPKDSRTVTLAPFDGMPVPPARISGRIKLRSVEMHLVAPVEGSRKGDPKKITIKLEAGPGFCGAKSHPHLTIAPTPPGLSGSMPIRGRTSCEFSVLAAPIYDPVINSELTPLAYISALIRKTDLSRSYTINSESCGNRNSSQAVSGLSCTITVYPEKLLILKLSLPEVMSGSSSYSDTTTTNRNSGVKVKTDEKKFEGEFTNRLAGKDQAGEALKGGKLTVSEKDIKVTDKSGIETNVSQNELRIQRTIYEKGKGIVQKTDTIGDLKISDAASGLSRDTAYEAEKSKGGMGYVAGIGFSLEHDGVELAASYKDYVEWVSSIKSLMNSADKVAKWLNSSVQVGWKVSGSIKILSGDIKVVWGLKQLPHEVLVGRYFGADIDISIVDASLSLSFGLAAAFPNVSDDEDLASARIIGTLSGSFKLKGAYEELTNSPGAGKKVTGTGAVILKLEGKIVAAKIIQLAADISGGVQVVGKWDGGIAAPPESTISANFTAVQATASVKAFFWKRKYGPSTLIGETKPFLDWKL